MVFVSPKPTLPRWLCEHILLGTLPWNQGVCQSYGYFSDAYTLHDSYLLGIYQSAETYGETVLCFLWDSLWMPEAISRQVSQHEPVFLLMKVTKTLGTALSEDTIEQSDRQPRRILKTEHVNVDDQQVLVIDDTQHNTLTVVFSGQLHFLAMDSQNRAIDLNMSLSL
ncbi:MAG: hypothetical protein AAF821_23935 [Cyanobacteria bacterium P01_D01_bin.156]